MSATAIDPNLTICISDAIRQNPPLFEAVNRASRFLMEEFQFSPPRDEAREATLTWELGQLDGPIIMPELEEKDSEGRVRSSCRYIPIRQTEDPVSMEIWMLRLVGDVLGHRMDKILERIGQHIRDMEQEENSEQ